VSIFQRLFFGYGGAIATDPNFASVSLLLHGGGAHGSTTLTDSSSNAHTVTANGNCAITTAESKYGGSSIACDGTGDYGDAGNHASFNIESGDFTVEGWIYRRLTGTGHSILNKRPPAANEGWGFAVRSVDTLIFYFTGGSQVISTATIPADQWVHVACTRSGNTLRLFIDGALDGTNASAANGTSGTTTLKVGRENDATADFNGYLDEIRITKGVARYTATFTPPTAPFPDS
jgi:hypothetical protein